MEIWKKALVLPIAAVFFLSSNIQAFAYEPVLSTTREFCRLMDLNEIVYTNLEDDEAGNEFVQIQYSGENCRNLAVMVIFSSDQSFLSVYAGNMLVFEGGNTDEAIRLVNVLNWGCATTKFLVDTVNSTVTAYAETPLMSAAGSGKIAEELVYDFVSDVDRAYPELIKLTW